MLTLAIGDLYIPERSIDLPAKFKKLLCPNPNTIPTNHKISRVVCLGNIINSQETLKFLYNLSPQFNLVKGENDNATIISQQLSMISHNKEEVIPYYNVFTHDNLRIGYTNGYQIVPKGDPLALSALARELDVDILIWGGTHRVEAYTLDGKFFINPGSATGAINFDWPDNEDYDEEKVSQEVGEKKDQTEETKEEEKEGQEEGEQKVEEQEKSDEKENEDKDNEKQDDAENVEQSVKDTTSSSNNIDKDILLEVTELNSNISSFCLLDIQGSTCILYIYTYLNGEVKVDKVTYTKD
ncbi:Vacuolar protein sorting-associated protein 29 [Spathaspora sp. JA1]|nr:Vacuolar protein sorting-associated protein 29 [Spathaspora sp. JA1]